MKVLGLILLLFFSQRTIYGQSVSEQIKDIREKYSQTVNDKEGGQFRSIEHDVECEYPTSGSIVYYYKGTSLRLIEHLISWSDHQWESRYYYVWDSLLFFAFYNEGGWVFDTEAGTDGKAQVHTIDDVTESRFYFAHERPIKCLTKQFSVRTRDDQPLKSEDIPNEEIECYQSKQVLDDFYELAKRQQIDLMDCFWE